MINGDAVGTRIGTKLL